MAAHPHRCWTPTPAQTLLLRAALLDGAAARAAYTAWRAAVDLHGTLDDGSFRLLPRLATNLAAAGVADADTARLRGIHRQSWAAGQLAQRQLAEALGALAAAGVPVIVLKGGALGVLYYRDPGERPMSDVDLLVRPADAGRAAQALVDLGWVPERPLAPEMWPPVQGPGAARLAPIGHGRSFARPADPRAAGLGLDLHWFAIPQCLRPDADRGFWERALPHAVGAARALTLAPEDHLVHALGHGVMWNVVPSIRWAADAALVVRGARGRPLDWARVVAEARARGLVLPVRETLAWLAAHLDVAVPVEVARALAAERVGLVDRWRYRYAQHAWTAPETVEHLAFDVFRYVEGRPAAGALPTLGAYARQRWGSANPLAIGTRLVARRLARGRAGA